MNLWQFGKKKFRGQVLCLAGNFPKEWLRISGFWRLVKDAHFPRRIGSWQCFQELLQLAQWARDILSDHGNEVSNYAATAIEILDEQIEDIYFTLRSKCWAPIKKRELQKQIHSRKNHGFFFPKEMKPICSSHCNHLFFLPFKS